MPHPIGRFIRAANQAIQRHGGGLAGFLSVLRRSAKVVSALGAGGFLARIRRATATPQPAVALAQSHVFPAPKPLEQIRLRAGVVAHVFYPELIGEFAEALANMPIPYELMVSVADDASRRQAEARFSRLPGLASLDVRVVENRGRDIAPLFVTFREKVLELDLVAHIHTKKSLYTGSQQHGWRRYLLNSLLGNKQRITWILGMFQADAKLGIVYPESYEGVPLWAHTLLGNSEACAMLASRIGMVAISDGYFDYPAGSMFWSRVDALRPLLDLKLDISDFPMENGQVDGTLQHAIERMLVHVATQRGMVAGILPYDGDLSLQTEGQRNWRAAVEMPLRTRIELSALDADRVSVDVFDTLVTRPFLTPSGARDFIAQLALEHHGVEDFSELRALAEEKARLLAGQDPTLEAIYRAMATLPGAVKLPTDELRTLELSTEKRILRPRHGMLDALAVVEDKKPIAISDMYLDSRTLQRVLPAPVPAQLHGWQVSCETGVRKDGSRLWKELPAREGTRADRWLHIGDNERSDVQMPQLSGLATPVHVLRPSALLESIPALRPLRLPADQSSPWPEQLWRGLMANRIADIADRRPRDLLSPRIRLDAGTGGYLVLGPLLLDYTTWLAQSAMEREIAHVLFLSREGRLLKQAFDLLQSATPALDAVRPHYFLASRRSTGMPTLKGADDLRRMLEGSFSGTLHQLLLARLGQEAVEAATGVLGPEEIARDIYLPEMADSVARMLEPCLPRLQDIAQREGDLYLRYLRQTVGSGSFAVADIGYAGTIQTQISRMTGSKVDGLYFALTDAARKIEGHGSAQARYYDARGGADTGDPTVIMHDLLLEALMIAPHGQFSHFHDSDGGIEPVYLARELDEPAIATLDEVHQGALDFVRDACDVGGALAWRIQMQRSQVLTPLRCLADGVWDGDAWLQRLSVRDDFTGRGRVRAQAEAAPARRAARPPTK